MPGTGNISFLMNVWLQSQPKNYRILKTLSFLWIFVAVHRISYTTFLFFYMHIQSSLWIMHPHALFVVVINFVDSLCVSAVCSENRFYFTLGLQCHYSALCVQSLLDKSFGSYFVLVVLSPITPPPTVERNSKYVKVIVNCLAADRRISTRSLVQ